MKRSGVADLPLHRGRVPQWLADRMSKLGTAIAESIIRRYGRSELLTRLSDPFWFQALGSVMGMDWHSSGITTSVMGALKRGLQDRSNELGIYICGGRGRHSRNTPAELRAISDRRGFDGEALVRTSRLTARIDNNAIQDGSFALGGKDRHPFPVPLKTYDESLTVLQASLEAAKLGDADKLGGFERLHRFVLAVEKQSRPEADFKATVEHEKNISPGLGGRSVFD